MTTRKLFLAGIAFSAIISHPPPAFSQGVYIRAGGGYAFAASKAPLHSYAQGDVGFALNVLPFLGTIDNPMLNVSIESDVDAPVLEIISDSYGKGSFTGISGGYKFNPYVGVEFGISYLFGDDINAAWDFRPKAPIVGTFRSKFSSVFLTPSLVLSAGLKTINPYIRAGITLGINPKIEYESSLSVALLPSTLKERITGNVAAGFSGAFGLNYPLNARVALYGELVYNSMVYKPHSRELTSFTTAGKKQDVSSFYTFPKQKLEDETRFPPVDPFAEETLRAYSYPLNSMGVNVGLEFFLGRSK